MEEIVLKNEQAMNSFAVKLQAVSFKMHYFIIVYTIWFNFLHYSIP